MGAGRTPTPHAVLASHSPSFAKLIPTVKRPSVPCWPWTMRPDSGTEGVVGCGTWISRRLLCGRFGRLRPMPCQEMSRIRAGMGAPAAPSSASGWTSTSISSGSRAERRRSGSTCKLLCKLSSSAGARSFNSSFARALLHPVGRTWTSRSIREVLGVRNSILRRRSSSAGTMPRQRCHSFAGAGTSKTMPSAPADTLRAFHSSRKVSSRSPDVPGAMEAQHWYSRTGPGSSR